MNLAGHSLKTTDAQIIEECSCALTHRFVVENLKEAGNDCSG